MPARICFYNLAVRGLGLFSETKPWRRLELAKRRRGEFQFFLACSQITPGTREETAVPDNTITPTRKIC